MGVKAFSPSDTLPSALHHSVLYNTAKKTGRHVENSEKRLSSGNFEMAIFHCFDLNQEERKFSNSINKEEETSDLIYVPLYSQSLHFCVGCA